MAHRTTDKQLAEAEAMRVRFASRGIEAIYGGEKGHGFWIKNTGAFQTMAQCETYLTYYSRPVTVPVTIRDGLANAVQLAINALEAGDVSEALLKLVDLRNDVRCKSNPYRLGTAKSRLAKSDFRGTVNVD